MYEMKNSFPVYWEAPAQQWVGSAGLATVLFSSEAARTSVEVRNSGSQRKTKLKKNYSKVIKISTETFTCLSPCLSPFFFFFNFC